jgi:hypothetical protein
VCMTSEGFGEMFWPILAFLALFDAPFNSSDSYNLDKFVDICIFGKDYVDASIFIYAN